MKIIAFILPFTIILLWAILVCFDPKLDWIMVEGKKKRILWYNNLDGEREWFFLP